MERKSRSQYCLSDIDNGYQSCRFPHDSSTAHDRLQHVSATLSIPRYVCSWNPITPMCSAAGSSRLNQNCVRVVLRFSGKKFLGITSYLPASLIFNSRVTQIHKFLQASARALCAEFRAVCLIGKKYLSP